jgi:hypothetical protein
MKNICFLIKLFLNLVYVRFIYLFIYVDQSPSWEANIHSGIKIFTTFYGKRSFIPVLTRARHWTLS